MGDRTQMLVSVTGGSPEVRRALAEAWDQYVGSTYGGQELDADGLLSGETWEDEISCGTSGDLRDEFERIVSEAVPADRPTRIEIYEDARYEWTGDSHKWTPDLGWWQGDIDNTGAVVIDEQWLRLQLEHARDLVDPVPYLTARLDELTGVAWKEES